MSNSDGSRRSTSNCSSGSGYSLNLEEDVSVQTASISSSLQCIPYQKLTDLKFINKGAYGTVHSACHSDWRVRVAVKFFPTERHLVERLGTLREEEGEEEDLSVMPTCSIRYHPKFWTVTQQPWALLSEDLKLKPMARKLGEAIKRL